MRALLSRCRWRRSRYSARSGCRCRDQPAGDGRDHRWDADGNSEPKAFGPQATKVAAVGAGEVPPAERITQQGQVSAQGCRRARESGAGATRLSPQGSFGVGSRQPSDLRRRPQHCGDGPESSSRPGHQRCGVGPVHADHRRESRTIWAHTLFGVALVGFQQNMFDMHTSLRRANTAGAAVDVSGVPDCSRSRLQRRQSHSRRRAGGEIKRLPRKWARPRERFRWSPVSPPTPRGARGDESGSIPTAA